MQEGDCAVFFADAGSTNDQVQLTNRIVVLFSFPCGVSQPDLREYVIWFFGIVFANLNNWQL